MKKFIYVGLMFGFLFLAISWFPRTSFAETISVGLQSNGGDASIATLDSAPASAMGNVVSAANWKKGQMRIFLNKSIFNTDFRIAVEVCEYNEWNCARGSGWTPWASDYAKDTFNINSMKQLTESANPSHDRFHYFKVLLETRPLPQGFSAVYVKAGFSLLEWDYIFPDLSFLADTVGTSDFSSYCGGTFSPDGGGWSSYAVVMQGGGKCRGKDPGWSYPDVILLTLNSSKYNTPPFGWLDKAVDSKGGASSILKGDTMSVSGWAADAEDGSPVSLVQVYLDSTYIGDASLGITKPDVADAFGDPRYTSSGWYMDYIIPSDLSLGTHTITAYATDSQGSMIGLNGSEVINITIPSSTSPVLSVGTIDLSNYVLALLKKDTNLAWYEKLFQKSSEAMSSTVAKTVYAFGAVAGKPLRLSTPVTNSGAATTTTFTNEYFILLNKDTKSPPYPQPGTTTGWDMSLPVTTSGIGANVTLVSSANIPAGLPQGTHGIVFCADMNGQVSDSAQLLKDRCSPLTWSEVGPAGSDCATGTMWDIVNSKCVPIQTCDSGMNWNGTKCVSVVNGGWGDWGSWGACVIPNGADTGTQTRSRSCITPFCVGSSSETKSCDSQNTSVDAVCAPTHYNCSTGTYAGDGASHSSNWTWTCNGLDNGATKSCIELKKKPVIIEN